ncbi:hypothetical protein HDK77DRAFT_423973 [Phyllosticta capitalensis]
MDESDRPKKSRKRNRSKSDTYAIACDRAEVGNTIRDVSVRLKKQITAVRNGLNASLSKMESKLIEANRGAPGTAVEDVISWQDPALLLQLVESDQLEEVDGFITKLALQPLLPMVQDLRRSVGRSAHFAYTSLLDFPEPFVDEDLDDEVYLEDEGPEYLLYVTKILRKALAIELRTIIEKRDIVGRFIEKFNKTLTSDMRSDRELHREYTAIVNLDDPRGQDKRVWDDSLNKLICYRQRKYVEAIEKTCQKIDQYKEALRDPKHLEDLEDASEKLDQYSKTLSE